MEFNINSTAHSGWVKREEKGVAMGLLHQEVTWLQEWIDPGYINERAMCLGLQPVIDLEKVRGIVATWRLWARGLFNPLSSHTRRRVLCLHLTTMRLLRFSSQITCPVHAPFLSLVFHVCCLFFPSPLYNLDVPLFKEIAEFFETIQVTRRTTRKE